MIGALRTLALALALAAVPACSALRAANPIPAHATAEQQAYAFLGAYALTLDQATIIVRNPSTPPRVKTALARAEAAATPAVELVKIAAVAHRRGKSASTAAALAHALSEAQGPVVALSDLLGE